MLDQAAEPSHIKLFWVPSREQPIFSDPMYRKIQLLACVNVMYPGVKPTVKENSVHPFREYVNKEQQGRI